MKRSLLVMWKRLLLAFSPAYRKEHLLRRKALIQKYSRLKELGTISMRLGNSINNPLSVIFMCTESLEDDASEENVAHCTDRMKKMVARISDVLVELHHFRQYASDSTEMDAYETIDSLKR